MKKNRLFLLSLASLAGVMGIGAVASVFNRPVAQTEAADAGTTTATEISGLKFIHNHLQFSLSASDYTTGGANQIADKTRIAEYNFLTNIKVYTSDTDYVPLSTMAATGTEQVYYFDLWVQGSALAIPCADSYKTSIKKVVVPSGTVFPTYEYAVSGSTSTTLNGYQISTEVTYYNSNEVFGTQDLTKTGDTTITNLTYHSNNADGSNGYLFIYSPVFASASANASYDLNRGLALNLFDKVTLTAGTDSGTIRSQCKKVSQYPDNEFFNLWTRPSCFVVHLPAWCKATPSDVKFAANAQFPDYTDNYKYYLATNAVHFVFASGEAYTDITALDSWATAFVTATEGNCHDSTVWTAQSNAYTALTAEQKAYFVSKAQTVYPEAYARLAFAVEKRGMTNFTALSLTQGASDVAFFTKAENNWAMIAALAGILLLSTAGFFYFKRKEQR